MAMAAHMTNRFSEIESLDQLKDAGMKEAQARVVVNLIKEASDFHTNELTTKDYVNARIIDVEKKITELELKMERRLSTLLLAVIVSILMPIALHFIGH